MIISKHLLMSIGDKIIQRFLVPPEKKSWSIEWKEYNPVAFSIDFANKPWADPQIGEAGFDPQWNKLDANIDRRSHEGPYQVVDGYPLNPLGRTGIKLRGLLGRWGPNHAADPIVTRWKRDDAGNIVRHGTTNLPILQFVAIQRRDTGDWAIPGGMVDPGEQVSLTVKREFFEEALNSLQITQEEKNSMENSLENFFSKGSEVFRGCVDDPRNTDNSWMETVAINFHDDTGEIIGKINLQAGDDAKNVKWVDVENSIRLYANHSQFIFETTKKLGAHWK